MPIVGVISLYVSLLTFTLRVHLDRLDYVDQVLVCFCFSISYLISLSLLVKALLSHLTQPYDMDGILLLYRVHVLRSCLANQSLKIVGQQNK